MSSSPSIIGTPRVVRKAGQALDLESPVVRVGDDIGDLLGPAGQADPADERSPVERPFGWRVM